MDLCKNNMVYFISKSSFKEEYLNEIMKVVNNEDNEIKVLEDG